MQVLWAIERDSDDTGDAEAGAEDEQRWWGARVVRREGPGRGYILLYDAYAEFEPAEVAISLVGPRALRDSSAGSERMRWRREGDEAEGADWDLLEDEAGEVSVREIVRAGDETGESDAVMAEFGKLPAHQQTTVAASYRVFADEVKSELARLVAQRGPGTVVTEQDIADMVGTLKARHGLA